MGLAIGLRSMPFHERQIFGQQEAGEASRTSLQLVDAVLSIPLRIQFIIWTLIGLLALLIGLFISPEMRKWLIRLVLRFAATYWLLYIFLTRYREVLAQMVINLSPPGATQPVANDALPPPAFVPPTGSTWLTYVLALGVAGILMFIAWKSYRIWRELNTPYNIPVVDRLAKIARSSLDDLSAGRDSTDVIMNCYFRMSDVVGEKKQISRKGSMTPAEFAIKLEQAGLPGDAVQQLTRLFESVRYGGYKTNSTMINEAVTCLTTILHYCGETI